MASGAPTSASFFVAAALSCASRCALQLFSAYEIFRMARDRARDERKLKPSSLRIYRWYCTTFASVVGSVLLVFCVVYQTLYQNLAKAGGNFAGFRQVTRTDAASVSIALGGLALPSPVQFRVEMATPPISWRRFWMEGIATSFTKLSGRRTSVSPLPS